MSSKRSSRSAANGNSPSPSPVKKPKTEANGDGHSACKWSLTTKAASPHVHQKFVSMEKPKIMDTVLDHIGKTPMVRLNKIPQSMGVECEVVVKCEFFNAGGSVKDRIGLRMVEEAEKSGRIKPGDTLIEPTSGNTGIGLALAAAIKGYRMIITLPEKMSKEKVDVLKALGAEIIRTPTEAAWDSPESHIGVALKLNKEIPNSHILDQYANPGNPLAHYDGTAEEILYQCDNKVDMVVMGAGTGGTLSGVARKIKERLPQCKVVGIDPVGSILAQPESLNGEIIPYAVEGIGYDFIPTVLDRSLVDEWVKSSDKESFLMARRLIKEEGLLCGGSSGTAVHYALQAAKKLKKGQRCVVVLPDSIRNYMTKHLAREWMEDEGHMVPEMNKSHENAWWAQHKVGVLPMQCPVTVLPSCTIRDALEIQTKQGFDQLPVVSESSEILGMVTNGNMISQITSGRVRKSDPVSKVLYKKFHKVDIDTPLWQVSHLLDRSPYVAVCNTQKCYSGADVETERTVVTGIVTRIDILNFITREKQ